VPVPEDAPERRRREKRRLAELRERGEPFLRPGPVRISALPWSLYKRIRYRAELEFAGMRTPMLAAVWINDWLVDPVPLRPYTDVERRRRLHRFRLPESVWARFDAVARKQGRDPEALLWDLLADRAPVPGQGREER
jgi:hypothetical protein